MGLVNVRWPKIILFAWRVLRDFYFRNHGLLITSSVAFHLMLSLIPLCAVLLTLSSHFADPEVLKTMIVQEVALIAPGFVPVLTTALEDFIRVRDVAGWVGLVVLFFFSSTAFRVLEDAFAMLYQRPLPTLRRKFWISALIPFLFILLISTGLLVITFLHFLIGSRGWLVGFVPGMQDMLASHSGRILYFAGVVGLFVLFSLFYKIMPVARISTRLALAGGGTATLLWEGARQLLVFYYANFSAVNLIYGSMTTLVVVLLTLEAIALILLLGAQVIAELQRNANLGLPWHADPEESPRAE
jgi:YihY family inner membrane protein